MESQTIEASEVVIRAAAARPGALRRAWDSDILHSFRRSPVTVVAAILTAVSILSAIGAPWLAPHDTLDLRTLNLLDASLPPAWIDGGEWTYPLGTDTQGRDMLSTILYGSRISILVGFCSVVFALGLGVTLGLISGYVGGVVDSLIMRIADVQLSFPAILIALLVDGVARVILPRDLHNELGIYVLILAIGFSGWVQFARTVRGSTMVEKNKEYVAAARIIGRHPVAIMLHHVLPNVMGPVLVITTIYLALAIITEATLSFLGIGLPPTEPSLGTLIRVGNNYLLSGEWWITIFPGVVLALLILSVNLLGDWLRDALNPKLR